VLRGLGAAALALALASCGAEPPTSDEAYEDVVLSPSGWFAITPADYGPAEPRHGVAAEAYWQDVEECFGRHHLPSEFPIYLHRWNVDDRGVAWITGWDYKGKTGWSDANALHVMGDPSFAQSWRHEMAHHLLRTTTGDPDAEHVRPEWQACDLIARLPR
jgi:hypothetical protein